MLNSAESVLLIVNMPSLAPPEKSVAQHALSSIGRIVKYAHALFIPTLYSSSSMDPQTPSDLALYFARPPCMITTSYISLLADPAQQIWRWPNAHRIQWIIAGLPSHVHVLQSALALNHAGKIVTVCEDACASIPVSSHHRAMHTMRQAGITIADVESIRYQWQGQMG